MKLELEPDETTMRDLAREVTERVVVHLATVDTQRASDIEGSLDAARTVIEPLPERGAPLGPLLDLVFEQLLPKGYNNSSPGMLSFLTGGALFHAALADFIVAATNPYVGYWASAPGFVQIEHTVVRWFCDMIGLPAGAGGVLTSGGSIANLTAITAARTLRAEGTPSRCTIYASSEAHHSIEKGVFLAGFPREALRLVASDEACRVRVDELERLLREDRKKGLVPLMLIGMAGTTGTGAVDDLPRLADLAERERLWFHVDAAYGGFFHLTARGRAALAGIDRADSVVLDPHKSLFMPFGSGCLLARREDDLRRAHLVRSHCVRESVDLGERVNASNPADLSLELTRECRGLPIWLSLKLLGADAFRRCLDEKLTLARWAADELRRIPGVEVLNDPMLSVVAFRVAGGNDVNRALLARINARGRVHLSGADVRGGYALRISALAFRAHESAIALCLEDLREELNSQSSPPRTEAGGAP